MQPRVRAASLASYCEVARFVGLDPEAMLRGVGIDPAILADPEEQLASAPVTRLIEDSARLSGGTAFGLLMAQSRTLASIGAVALLLKHQHTARDVLDAVVRYQILMAEVIDIRVEETGDTTIIHAAYKGEYRGRQSIEYLTAMIYRMICELTGGRWHPESVHFMHDAPDDLSVHRRIFQCPLSFQNEFDGLVCATRSLDVPNPAADSVMARHAQRYLDMLIPDPRDGSITERARRSIYLLLPAGRATLEQVGENLGVHPRSLQRLMEKEGRAFATLLNEVRRELALRYLSSSTHSVTAIAQMTGYAAPSSFTRWFCAEFGVSPAAWRAAEAQTKGASASAPAAA
jgi:AraC-like DNA-binding protein